MKTRISSFGLLMAGVLLAGVAGPRLCGAEWALYDGFDYRSPSLEGADGGAGPWRGGWKRSAGGGVTLAAPGFDYTDVAGGRLATTGRRAQVTGRATAGVYRDFDVAAGGATDTLWLSFLARVEGAPFDNSGDELSLQLRADKDVELLTIGVFGKLNEWRIRTAGSGGKLFSKGAGGQPRTGPVWVVVRVTADGRHEAADTVLLWINPSLGREPADSAANTSLSGRDIWGPEHPFHPVRMRIGIISVTKDAPEKSFQWDEIRMGKSFADVAPSER